MHEAMNILGFAARLLVRLIILPAGYAALLIFAGTLMMGTLGPWVALVIGIVVAVLNLRLRRRRGQAVVYYLEQAVRLNLPLTDMLDAAAASERWKLRRTLIRLRRQLEAGEPLSEALRDAAPEVDDRAVNLIAASQNTGRLAATLRWLIAPGPGLENEQADNDAARRRYVWLYPVVMIVAIAMMVSAAAIFIMPKYEAIMADFDLPMPAMTQTLARLGRIDVMMLWMTGLIAAAGALWLWVTWATFCPDWLKAWRWLPGVGLGFWYTPIVGALARDRDMRDVMRVLGSAAATGMSLEMALTEAMQLRVNPVTRRRLLLWRSGLESGLAVDEAARAARLPKLVTGMLATVRQTNQLPRAIGYLGRYYEDKFSRAAELAGGAVVPAVELVLGVMVAWVVLAVLMPMFALLESVTRGGI